MGDANFVPFVGGSYIFPTVNFDAQRSVNFYPVKSEVPNSQTVDLLRMTPGLNIFQTLGPGPIRGEYTVKGRTFVVSGFNFYEIFIDGSNTNYGTVFFANPVVSISDNGVQVCVVGGNNGYIFTLATNVLVQITTAGWNGANTVTFLDGYFVWDWPGTSQYYVSALYDGTTINPTAFASVSSSTNNVVAVKALHQNLWVFGTESVEIEYDNGNQFFPFSRIQGVFIEYGCAAPLSVVSIANTVLWLGKDSKGQGVVWMANGYQPERVSTQAIEYTIQEYGDITGANAWAYQSEGQFFYCLNIPGPGTTLVFDISQKQWHERAFWNVNSGLFEQHRAICHTFNFNQHMVGDYQNGNIYIQSTDIYSDYGNVVRRMRTAPHMIDNLDFVFYDSFQLDMETGIGLDGSPAVEDVDPQVVMSFSNDGGHTWSSERSASMGKIGAYKARAIWRRLGRARDRVFKVITSTRNKINILGAVAKVNPGVN